MDPTGEPRPINPNADRERPREASMQLRDGASATATQTVLMDPANESLADALRITFRLLQFGMIVLVGVFVFSGFQSVREGQSGIRLLFGKADSDVLEPGFRFAFPYPVGELVKVQTGTTALVENTAFWPSLPDGTPAGSVDQIPPRDRLRPAEDGSVLTADGAIAHTQWSIQYRRDDPRRFAATILPGDEDAIVRAAVQRGVVQAVATTTIDDLLKQGASGGEALAVRARSLAQATLDDAGSGILIENLSLEQKIPPRFLKERFDGVQAAASEATTSELEAETEASETLNRVAGPAAGPLIRLIDAYEAALETGDADEAERVLTTIDAVLEGGATAGELAGAESQTDIRVSGEVSRIIAEARRERSEAVLRARAELALFDAQRAKFEANPGLTIKQIGFDALRTFLDRPFVQVMSVPRNTDTLQLLLNADPDLRRALIRDRQFQEAVEAEERRERNRREGEFTIDRGLPTQQP